jgi:hypothetical protein
LELPSGATNGIEPADATFTKPSFGEAKKIHKNATYNCTAKKGRMHIHPLGTDNYEAFTMRIVDRQIAMLPALLQ